MGLFSEIPVGANKRFLVSCNGTPCAGFNTATEAASYIEMQRSKKKGSGPAAAAQMTWKVEDRGMKNG